MNAQTRYALVEKHQPSGLMQVMDGPDAGNGQDFQYRRL